MASMTTLQRTLTFTGVAAATGDPTVASAWISRETGDRDGDWIVAAGVDVEAWKKNPIVQYGHDNHALPVGRGTSIEVVPDEGIKASWRWLENDPFADRVRNAWNQRVLNAVSVGLLVHEF